MPSANLLNFLGHNCLLRKDFVKKRSFGGKHSSSRFEKLVQLSLKKEVFEERTKGTDFQYKYAIQLAILRIKFFWRKAFPFKI